MSRIPHKPYKGARVYDLDRFPTVLNGDLQEPIIYAEDFVGTREDWLKHEAAKFEGLNMVLSGQEPIENPKSILEYLNEIYEYVNDKAEKKGLRD